MSEDRNDIATKLSHATSRLASLKSRGGGHEERELREIVDLMLQVLKALAER